MTKFLQRLMLSRFVNGQMGSAQRVGEKLADDHRFLVNEKFKVVMAFIDKLSFCYDKGHYDLERLGLQVGGIHHGAFGRA